MAYVPNCRYDLFISYAHVDNEPGPDSAGWVTAFHNSLARIARQKLGRDADDFRIFFDPILRANQQLPELLEAAENSAIFIGIGSPSWATRDFCRKEVEAFSNAAADSSRIFLAEFMPLDKALDYPKQVDQHLRLEFHTSKGSIGHIRMPLSATSEADQPLYFERIYRLADQVVEKLRLMREAARGAGSNSFSSKTDDSPVVLLAEPTDDLEDYTANLAAYLEQYGVRPLFAPKNYHGTKEFEAQFKSMLRAADMFVQLLGPYAGKRPPDLPQGFTAYQAEEAARSGKPVLQWRRPDLDLAQTLDAHRRLLEGKDVVSSTFEDFKARAKDGALASRKPAESERQRKVARPSAGPSLIFIDADAKDLAVAEEIGRALTEDGMDCMLPSTGEASDDRLRDLEDSLVECDVLVCLYGSAQSHWVRAQLRLLAKIKPRRASDLRVLAVCTGPPTPKDSVGAMYRGLQLIDCGGSAWNIAPIRDLISELRQ